MKPRAPYHSEADLPRLREKAERLGAKVERLERAISAPDPITDHFHLGRVGGSGRNVKALNKRRERDLERTISQAVEARKLRERRARVLGQIAAVEEYPRQLATWERAEAYRKANPEPPAPKRPSPEGSPIMARSEWNAKCDDYKGRTAEGFTSCMGMSADGGTCLFTVEIVPDDSPRLLTERRLSNGRVRPAPRPASADVFTFRPGDVSGLIVGRLATLTADADDLARALGGSDDPDTYAAEIRDGDARLPVIVERKGDGWTVYGSLLANTARTLAALAHALDSAGAHYAFGSL